MCGIVAAVSRVDTTERVQRALRALSHRGPDGDGLWHDLAGRVVLGHTRLSIIDLAGGQQPIVNETGDVAVAINGQFYGHDRVLTELADRGHRLRTRSDSEIVLHLYEESGLDVVHQLRGEFALVLWDDRRGRLIAVRDRFGVKPLFYASTNEEFWIASEAKALFAAGFPARWDERSFHEHLFLMHGAGRTLFEGIHQLPAGHVLVVEDGRAKTIRYWDLDYPLEAAIEPCGDGLEAFRDCLDDAIRVRLRADIPVGFFLSGGIDSSAVLGFAARHWDVPGRAFTVRFDQAEYDEGAIAESTAAELGACFQPIPLSTDQLAGAYADAVAHGETLGHFHAAARYLQCQAVHQSGYKVALTGDGADEVLAGYAHFATDVTPGSADDVPLSLRPMQSRLGHVPAWVRALAVERSIFNVLLARDYRDRMRSSQPYRDCLDDLDCDGQIAGRHPLHASLYLWSKTLLPNYVLAAERLEMAFGVETRPPFLDHVLFDTIRRLPPSMLVRGRIGKCALRTVARGIVPDAVLTPRKHPFAAPTRLACVGSPLFNRVDEQFHGAALGGMPFFDRAAVLRLWDEWPAMPLSRRVALEPALLMIFCACVLHETYVDA